MIRFNNLIIELKWRVTITNNEGMGKSRNLLVFFCPIALRFVS